MVDNIGMENGDSFSSSGTDRSDQLQHGAWKQVSHRKKHPYSRPCEDSATGKANQSQNNLPKNPKSGILERLSLSFYLTNFPHNVSYKDLWNRCGEWGTVVDVFIANRLSKAGKRFAFVRFIKVDDADLLRSNLNTMWFAKFKVYADIVRFNRTFHARKPISQQQAKMDSTANLELNHNHRKSYADVAAGKNNNSSAPSNNSIPLSTTPFKRRIVKVTRASEGEGISSTSSILLKVIEPAFIPSVRQWFHSEGFVDVSIYYVGGRWLHVTFASVEGKDLFLANDSLKVKFGAIKSPDDRFIPDERMVWVEVFGVPKGTWHTKTFVDILDPWGKGEFFDCEWNSVVSVGKVCLLSKSQNFIFEELTVSLDDKLYNVWIKEFASWEPNLLSPTYVVNSSDTDGANSDDTNGFSESDGIGNNGDDDGLSSNSDEHSSNDKSSELSSTERLMNDDRSARSVSFDSDLCKDHSDGDCGNDAIEENADVISSNKVSFESNQNSSFPEVVEEWSSLERSGVKEERTPHHNNGLDDHDVFLLNRLLDQDKCRVRPVKAEANENFKVSSEASLKQDQSINEVIGSGKQKQSSSFVLSPSTPPVTDQKLAEESCYTWLDYVGPLSTDELDPEICWSYKDPSGDVQGSFSLAQLHKWKDYFPSDFKVWRYYGSVKDTVLLHSALKRRTKDVG